MFVAQRAFLRRLSDFFVQKEASEFCTFKAESQCLISNLTFAYMRILINTVFLVFFLLLFTCRSSSDQQPPRFKAYFDIKSFVNSQISLLTSKNPKVKKTMFSDGMTEIRSQKNVNWKKELELFVQADINKPAYGKSYKIFRPDSLTYEYILKPGETLPVQKLEIVVDNGSGKPRLIRAVVRSKNKLYESQKYVELQCKTILGEWSIVAYHIKGYQKLAVLDSSKFEITGLVY